MSWGRAERCEGVREGNMTRAPGRERRGRERQSRERHGRGARQAGQGEARPNGRVRKPLSADAGRR
ncbi:hypothetical protein GCM10009790_32470 [Georgenia ruanii]